jgi:hypothetical protein
MLTREVTKVTKDSEKTAETYKETTKWTKDLINGNRETYETT